MSLESGSLLSRGVPGSPGEQGSPGDPESSGESFGPGAKAVPRIRRESPSARESPNPRGSPLARGQRSPLEAPESLRIPGEAPSVRESPEGESPFSPGLPDPRERGGERGRERGRSRVYSWRALRYIRLSGRRRPSLGCASRVRATGPMPRQGRGRDVRLGRSWRDWRGTGGGEAEGKKRREEGA